MILNRQPLSLNEVQDMIKDIPENEKKTQMELYLKKFLKTKPERAKKIREGLEKLELMKIKDEHIVKIIDLLPDGASDLNKIFVDASLNEDEESKILEVVKNSK